MTATEVEQERYLHDSGWEKVEGRNVWKRPNWRPQTPNGCYDMRGFFLKEAVQIQINKDLNTIKACKERLEIVEITP